MSIKVKGKYKLITGDCRERLKKCPDNYFDSVVCDPPYGLEFMGKEWDKLGANVVDDPSEVGGFQDGQGGNAFSRSRIRYGSSAKSMQEWHYQWAVEVLRVLKPGGHLLAFGGTRTYHRLACAIEDAGFQIRDCIMWVYGSGFPKSADVSKAIDKKLGAERETIKHKPRPETSGTMSGSMDTRPWIEESRKNGFHEVAGNVPVTPEAKQYEGFGTALKPSHEPIIYARKPLTMVPFEIMIQTENLIGGLICLSLSSVKHAKSLLESSQVEHEEDANAVSAHLIASINRMQKSDDRSEKMVTFKSPVAAEIILSIVNLWRSIWDACCYRQSMFTTEMVIGLTTELRTLKSLILPIIQDCITQEGMLAVGKLLCVSTAEGNLKSPKKHRKNFISAQGFVTLLSEPSGAKCVDENFMQAAVVANTVLQNAITNLAEKFSPNAEPVVLARKPLIGTVAENVLEHGTGGINVDGCRIEGVKGVPASVKSKFNDYTLSGSNSDQTTKGWDANAGRFPANLIHDGSEEVLGLFPGVNGHDSAARFFYTAKTSKSERNAGLNDSYEQQFEEEQCGVGALRDSGRGKTAYNPHPTVKPVDLMRYLVRLVTPKNGHVLDPFMGSGSTGIACGDEGFQFTGIELDDDMVKIAEKRMERHFTGFSWQNR